MTVADTTWMGRALCNDRGFDAIDPEWWFAPPNSWQRRLAAQVCQLCPVRRPCLRLGVEVCDSPSIDNIRGLWGGIDLGTYRSSKARLALLDSGEAGRTR